MASSDHYLNSSGTDPVILHARTRDNLLFTWSDLKLFDCFYGMRKVAFKH